MRWHHHAACWIVAALVGCGPSEPFVVVPKAPHGGSITPLPDHLGNLEVIREEVAGRPDQVRVRLYFIDFEGKPIAAAPTTADLKPRERGAAAIGFKPVAAGELESPPLRATGGIAGQLTTTIGGKPITLSVDVR